MLITLLDFFCSRPFPEPPKRKTRWIVALSACVWAVIAFVVGLIFCGNFALPGENAAVLGTFTGALPASNTTFPLLRTMIGMILGETPTMLGLNLFGAAIAGLLLSMTWLMAFFWTRDAMNDDSVVGYSSWVAQLVAHAVCLCFLFTLPGLYTVSAFTHHGWCFLWALLCAVLQNAYAMHNGRRWRMALFAVVLGIGLIESPWVAILFPVFALRTLAIEWRLWDHNVRNLPLWFIMVVVGATLAVLFGAWRLDGELMGGLTTLRFEIPRLHYAYAREFFSGTAWLLNIAAALIFPILAWITARRLLNNERILVLLITATILTFGGLGLLFGLERTPIYVWLSHGLVPIATTWMFALACGFLTVGWGVQLFAKNSNSYEEVDRRHVPMEVTAMRVAALLLHPICVIGLVAILGIQTYCFVQMDRSMADRFALETVNVLASDSGTPVADHTFILGRAWIDRHLALTAQAKGVPLTIFSPDRAQDSHYLETLKLCLETSPALGDADRLRLIHLLEYNFLVFIQDFFTAQPDVEKIAVAYDMSDVWYASKVNPMRPMPYGTLFYGVAEGALDPLPAHTQFTEIQKRWAETLASEKLPWWDFNAPVLVSIRHHLAVIANNMGTIYDDIGSEALNRAIMLNDEIRSATARNATAEVATLTEQMNSEKVTAVTALNQAANYYYDALKINKDNISALLNLYDICVRRGFLADKREETAKRFNDFIVKREKGTRKLNLNAVGRAFGYIRNYELFVQMGWDWAINAAPESVLAGLRNAQSGLNPADPRNAQVQSVVASIYELQGQSQRSFESYQVALQHNPKNIEALRGLARLSIQNGKLHDAGRYLAEAEAAGADKTTLDLDRAAYCMAIGDHEGATKALGNYTTTYKDSAIGWAMLGMLEIEKGNLDEASGYILQNIKRTAKESGDLYFQHILEGRLMHLKALEAEALSQGGTLRNAKARADAVTKANLYWEDARKHYRRAYALKPNVRGLLEIILDFDRRLKDKDGAEADAFAILRDDPRHPFANFIVGSQRLEDAEVKAALNYFKLAIDGQETPPIDLLNNYVDALARTDETELLREMGRRAVTQAPDNYAAWGSYALGLARLGDVKEAKTTLARAHEIIREAAKSESTRFTPDPRLAYVNVWIAIAEKNRPAAEKALADLKTIIGDQMTPLDKKDFTDIDSALQKLSR